MTLTPEPRPARRPFATSKDAGWTPRAEMEALEQNFIVEPIYAHHLRAMDPSIGTTKDFDQVDHLAKQAVALANFGVQMQAAIDQVTTAFNIFTIFGTALWAGSPRSRRRIRKQLRLVAHYQKKLDRIPTWKRTTSPKGTK